MVESPILSGVSEGPDHRMVFDRACEHLEAFNVAAKAWLDESAYLSPVERDRDTFQAWGSDLLATWATAPPEYPDDAVGTKVIFRENYPINPNWALVLNEAIHGLRSSLDHLAFSLALAKGPLTDKEIRDSEFPIFWESGPNGSVPSRLPQKIAKIDAQAQTIIKGLQPYKDTDYRANKLWVLHELDRIGKHRLIPVVASFNTSSIARTAEGVRTYSAQPGIGPLVNGAPVARYVFGPGPNGEVNVRFEVNAELMFGLIMGDQFPPVLLAEPGTFPTSTLGVPVPNLGTAGDTVMQIRDYMEAKVFGRLETFLV